MPPYTGGRPQTPRSRPPLPPGLTYEQLLLPAPLAHFPLPPGLRIEQDLLPVPRALPSPPRRTHSLPGSHQPVALHWLAGSPRGRERPRARTARQGRPATGPSSYTPWILNFDRTSTTHKCADIHLFRPPFSGQGTDTSTRTVVLPILPGPVRLFNFDVSVMTLTPVRYTPGATYSELNWPLLASEGFTKHDLHHDHEHDSTHGNPLCRGIPRRKVSSVVRHPNIPGVDLLWCGYDEDDSPHVLVHMTAFDMVNLELWSEGVKTGVVGQAADTDGRLAWIEPGDDSRFERIVQGGVGATVP